ncbi:MAG: CPBP family intramembrane metalloprotease [Lentisphaerae bacterium]|nr:CPBP family intramembrane metalloprotease [Lentisphaerota bacterium]
MFDSTNIKNMSLQQAIAALFANPIVLFCFGTLLLLILQFSRRRPDWASLSSRLTERAWTVRGTIMLISAIILLVLTGKLVVSLAFQAGLIMEERTLHAAIVANSLFIHGAILLLAAITARCQKISLTDNLGLNCLPTTKSIKQAVVAYLASVPLVGIATVLSGWSLHEAGIPPEPQYVVQIITDTESTAIRIVFITIIVVTAPLAEEIFFRGICMPMLAKHFGMTFAVSIVSILFAAIHLHLHSVIPLIMIAIVFAVSYIYSGSIIVPILTHMIFNATGLTILFLAKVAHKFAG